MAQGPGIFGRAKELVLCIAPMLSRMLARRAQTTKKVLLRVARNAARDAEESSSLGEGSRGTHEVTAVGSTLMRAVVGGASTALTCVLRPRHDRARSRACMLPGRGRRGTAGKAVFLERTRRGSVGEGIAAPRGARGAGNLTPARPGQGAKDDPAEGILATGARARARTHRHTGTSVGATCLLAGEQH